MTPKELISCIGVSIIQEAKKQEKNSGLGKGLLVGALGGGLGTAALLWDPLQKMGSSKGMRFALTRPNEYNEMLKNYHRQDKVYTNTVFNDPNVTPEMLKSIRDQHAQDLDTIIKAVPTYLERKNVYNHYANGEEY